MKFFRYRTATGTKRIIHSTGKDTEDIIFKEIDDECGGRLEYDMKFLLLECNIRIRS